MNAYSVVLKPAKVALIVLALSVASELAGIVGLSRYRGGEEQTLIKTEEQLASTRDQIGKLTHDLDSINKLASRYQQISRLGFIGEPDRDAWVQSLETIYRDTRLPPTLRYTLAPPQLLNPQAVSADAPPAYLNNVLHHDLALELSGIHEGELLDFIGKLGADWRVPYRVETCQITREAENEPITGLQINCTLQLYSLPDKTVVSR